MDDEERQRCLQSVTKRLVWLTAACLAVLVLAFYWLIPAMSDDEKPGRTYLVVFVFAAGLLGGFVSIQQRLPTVGLEELRELSRSWVSILLIPLNGGVFSLVLMLMFVSGILEGSVFPRYEHTEIVHGGGAQELLDSFNKWLLLTFPKTGPDVAKLLFWSFVAGFSERFVPQIIRKTAGRNENEVIGRTEPGEQLDTRKEE